MRRPHSRPHRSRASVASAAVAAWLLAAGCTPNGDPAVASNTDGPSGEVIVFAAASLTDAFEEIVADLADRHPELEVVLNVAGSQVLAGQLTAGAAADVFASADHGRVDAVIDADLAGDDPAVFATNDLVIVVERGNPHGIAGLADLADTSLIVVLPAPEVPAGAYAREALQRAAVDIQPSSLERDVRAAMAKVSLGEADAAIGYASDVLAADGRVDGVPLAPEHAVTVEYPVVVLHGAPNAAGAQAFIDHLLGPDGRRVLERHGFGTP